MKVYISYPIEFCSSSLELNSMKSIVIHSINNKCEIFDPKKIDSLFNFDIEDIKKNNPDKFLEFVRIIKEKDCLQLSDSDFIIALPTKDFSGGMAGELTLANWLKKPVFMLSPKENRKYISSWVRSCATYEFETLESLIQYIQNYISV